MERNDDGISQILEAVFTALERGETPDWEGLTGGDGDLRRRVQRLVDGVSSAERALGALGGRPIDETLPAERLGEYRLVSFLGAGGMGRVYLAEQQSLGRMVALKVLDPAFTKDRVAQQRFHREAEIAAGLDHPNIVPVLGIDEDQGFSFIAMKWLTGPSLEALHEAMEPREVARIGIAIADALGAAHREGIVHRDVKPANIILDVDVPYLADFGLARGSGYQTLTALDTAPGTLQYIPPERLRGDSDPRGFDPNGDLYALGATLYHCVAGRPPFQADQPERLIHQIIFKDPPPLRLEGEDRDLETIVLRALDKDPALRFPNATAFAADLGRYLRGEPIESHPTGLLTRTYKLVRRHRRVASWIGVFVFIALALSGMLALRLWNDRREFREDLREVRLRLDSGQLATSRTLLERLRRAAPDDHRVHGITRDLEEKERRVRAAAALEDLLDRIQDRPEAWISRDLKRLAERVRSEGSLAHDNQLERMRLLALQWVELHQGHGGKVLRALDDIERRYGEGRGSLVLRAMAEKREAWALPEDDSKATANEHVMAAFALRLANRPRKQQQEELYAALRKEPENFRAQFALAVFYAGGSNPVLARDFFLMLPRANRRSRTIRRQIARLDLMVGDIVEARQHLDEAGPPQTGVEAGIEVELLLRERRFQELDRKLAAWMARWPDSAELRRCLANRLVLQGRIDEAMREYGWLTEAEVPAFYREDARLALCGIELQRLLAAKQIDEGALRAFSQRCVREAGLMLNLPLQARMLVHAATAARRSGDLDRCGRLIRHALDADQSSYVVHLEFTVYAWEAARQLATQLHRVEPPEDVDAKLDTWARLVPVALAGMRHARLVREGSSGMLAPRREDIQDALTLEMCLARLINDAERTLDAAELLEESHEEDPPSLRRTERLRLARTHIDWAMPLIDN